jgi:hypothetical protein
MSKCKNMKMRKYITPSVEMQPVQAVGLILSASITSLEGGDQETAQAPRRRVF